MGSTKLTDAGLAATEGFHRPAYPGPLGHCNHRRRDDSSDRANWLDSLGLDATAVGDAGLVRLAGLTSLRTLTLSRTTVTDAGLIHLQGMPGLSTLWLADTKVTDAGLTQLKGLTNLASLTLRGTKVTDAGVRSLERRCRSWW